MTIAIANVRRLLELKIIARNKFIVHNKSALDGLVHNAYRNLFASIDLINYIK